MSAGFRPDHLDVPHRQRLDTRTAGYGRILEQHRLAVELGFSMYRDPLSGAMVMTASYLAERGYCCNSGCRHCPYLGAD